MLGNPYPGSRRSTVRAEAGAEEAERGRGSGKGGNSKVRGELCHPLLSSTGYNGKMEGRTGSKAG